MANGDLLPPPPPKGTTTPAGGRCCPSVLPPPKTYELTACSISYTKPATNGGKLWFLNDLARGCGHEAAASATYILNDVSFTARPGELLAIVGPSGAGKSTLLDILAARTAPTAGELFLNSGPLRPSSYRKISAHVPQHDLAFPHLTVRETFAFAASLLLHPGGHPAAATSTREETVAALLADLNLSRVADSRISDNLSGGERRRVSLGLALLRDPAVLLLDEPTSGLDSSSAYGVMRALRALAVSRRRTVVVSIHQPSFKILGTIDSILLLSRGTVLHHGGLASLETSLVSRGFSIPPQLNPLDYAMEINTQLHHQQRMEADAKAAADDLTTIGAAAADDDANGAVVIKSSRAAASKQTPAAPTDDVVEVLYRSSRIHEIAMLYLRFWKIVIRTRQLLLTNALEAVGVGFVLGTIYIRLGFDEQGVEKRLGLLAFTLTFLLSSTVEALPIFVNERPILLREASSGLYRLSSHVVATTLVFLPYLLALSLAYSAAVYFLAGLCPAWTAFGFFVLVVWAVVLMANSFVLFISSLAPNYIAGTSLITVSLAGFFLFSGYFLAAVPKYWLFMRYLSLYKWALDALVANEYWCAGMVGRCFSRATAPGGQGCAVTGADILEEKGLTEGQRWTNVHIMLGYFLLYRVLYWAVLARRVSMSKK